MKLIKNATVYTMNNDNEVISNCDILIEGSKIAEIGANIPAPKDTKTFDATGYVITPGLIDAHTHVGIQGEATDGMNDHNEISHSFTPLMSAMDSINPEHHSFKDARSGGVTTVQTGSGSHNVIGGVWCVVKTNGKKTLNEIVLRERSGLKGALGENPKNRHGQINRREPYTRMAIANKIRHTFKEAEIKVKEDNTSLEELYTNNQEYLIPFIEVLQKKMPLRLHAHRADDIITAIRIAQEFNFNLSIEHCTEGFKVVSKLKDAGYPVVVGPIMGQPTKYETRDLNLESPKILNNAGLQVAINTDHPVNPIQYLSISAANAAKNGMDEMEALRSITITPATICGVNNRVGSIEVGKDADLVLWSGHPFKTRTTVIRTIINGETVFKQEK